MARAKRDARASVCRSSRAGTTPLPPALVPEGRGRVDAMMAGLVRPRARTPSASDRHQDRVRDPIHGLESLDSGPHISPVEPAAPLDRREGAVRYLGMDVHAASTVWCLLEAQGDVVGEGRTATTAVALTALMRELGPADQLLAGQEVGTLTYLVHDAVTAAGVRLLSFNAAQLRMIAASRKKTDRRDAYWIANAAPGTLRIPGVHGVEHRARAAERVGRVSCSGVRRPEGRHVAVAEVLVDRPVVREHRSDHPRVEFTQHPDDALGCLVRAPGGEPHEVDEEHRHGLLARLGQRRVGGGQLLDQPR